jgi:hypothetical protein
MPATKIGIVYATKSKIIRRVISPDDDAELDDAAHVQPGETMLRVSHPPVRSVEDVKLANTYIEDVIKAATGVQPPSPRCIAIDGVNIVRNVISADPDLDSLPGHTLRLHAYGDIDDRWTGSTVLRRYVVCDDQGIVRGEHWLDPANAQMPSGTPARSWLCNHPTVAIGAKLPLPPNLILSTAITP